MSTITFSAAFLRHQMECFQFLLSLYFAKQQRTRGRLLEQAKAHQSSLSSAT